MPDKNRKQQIEAIMKGLGVSRFMAELIYEQHLDKEMKAHQKEEEKEAKKQRIQAGQEVNKGGKIKPKNLSSMSIADEIKGIMSVTNPKTNKKYTESEAKKLIKYRKDLLQEEYDRDLRKLERQHGYEVNKGGKITRKRKANKGKTYSRGSRKAKYKS